MAERDGWVRALAIHDGGLIDAGHYHQIFFTDGDEPIIADPDEFFAQKPPGATLPKNCSHRGVFALAVQDGQIFQASNYSDCNPFEPPSEYYQISRADDNEIMGARGGWLTDFAFYNGRPLVARTDQLRNGEISYFDNNELMAKTDEMVHSLLPIDNETADRLLTLKGVREIR
jgi:hypothetical protein